MDSILTVVTAAENHRLTELATVKTLFGIAGGDSDVKLDILIDQASVAAVNYCRRIFAYEKVSETFRPTVNEPVLRLSRRPIVSLVSVTEDATALVAADTEIDAESGLLYRLTSDARTKWAAAKITVVYNAGYVLPADAAAGNPRTLPEALEAGVIELVGGALASAGRDPVLKSESVPGVLDQQFWIGDVPGADNLPASVRQKFDPYRNLAMG